MRALACAALVVSASGCATVVSGTTEQIRVVSEPPGACVRLLPGPLVARTPATLEVPRGEGPYRVTVDHEGYEREYAYIRFRTNRWVLGNLLINSLIGVGVDWFSGAVNDLDPDRVHVTLVQEPPNGPRPSAEDAACP